MTINEAKKKVLDLARAEIGYHETGENQTKYASAYNFDNRLYGFDMSGQPWCDYFVDWLFMVSFGFNAGSMMTFQYSGCAGASCEMSAQYYVDSGSWYSKPSIGDQIFFYSGGGINHTGIVESVDGNYVTSIEGNSSDSVRRNVYRLNDPTIAGYGRPVWKLAEKIQAEAEEKTEQTETSSEVIYDEDGEEVKEPCASCDFFQPGDICEICYYAEDDLYFCSDLEIDSEFGPLTEKTLYDFQKIYGLEADGKAGPETWKKIAEQLGWEILQRGSEGYAVAALQAALNAISD